MFDNLRQDVVHALRGLIKSPGFAEVIEFREMSKTMTSIGAWSTGQQNLTGDGEPIRVGVGFVTANCSACGRCSAA